MKRNYLLLTSLLLLATLFAGAQGGGFQRASVEDRVKVVHNKIDSAFSLEADKLKKIDEVFTTYYKEQDKVLQELMQGGGRPDRDAMQAKTKPLADARDASLQGLLTADQYTTWKEKIEPTLRPGGGRGGSGRGGNQ